METENVTTQKSTFFLHKILIFFSMIWLSIKNTALKRKKENHSMNFTSFLFSFMVSKVHYSLFSNISKI